VSLDPPAKGGAAAIIKARSDFMPLAQSASHGLHVNAKMVDQENQEYLRQAREKGLESLSPKPYKEVAVPRGLERSLCNLAGNTSSPAK
jgi:hypothetical protein